MDALAPAGVDAGSRLSAVPTDWRSVGAAELAAAPGRFDALIDVRSPAEYALDHLPGAINLPVLDDTERAEVGTLYRRSPFEARRLGAALVSRRIAGHLETALRDCPRTWRPLVYCWRGGQRSAAMAEVLERVGWPVRRLEGGYRAWRAYVVADLARLAGALHLRVVSGPTGSGKTELLQALAQEGAQTLDLEALARHRGSVLGAWPDAPQPGQKAFESALWGALRALQPDRPVYVESESRKIGNLQLPEPVVDAMRAAPVIALDLAAHQRVALLRAGYRHHEQDPDRLVRHLRALAPLHGHERIEAWAQLAHAGRWDELVGRLLVEHYDPAYRRSLARNYGTGVLAAVLVEDATPASFAAAARRVIEAA